METAPTPVPKKKNKKPPVIADAYNRILIASIASYTLGQKGTVVVRLKSGEVEELDYGVHYLSKKVIAELDTHFNVTQMEANPCNICIRKDIVPRAERGNAYKWTFCTGCHSFRDFRHPGGSVEDQDEE